VCLHFLLFPGPRQGEGDEAGFEDREFGLAQDSHDHHYLFLSTKTEGH